MDKIIKPSVAGRFYPAIAQDLAAEVEHYIGEAEIEPSGNPLLAILTPHAGYPFSGPIAGVSFKYAQKQNPDAVLFLALSHSGVKGGCVFNEDAFETPLGLVEVDREITQALIQNGDPLYSEVKPFQGEHSVEVNLPFVQKVFPQAKVAAMLISRTDPDLCREIGRRVAEIIQRFPEKKILLTVSSDMSHFPDYETANRLDKDMLKSLESLDPKKIYHDLEKLEKTPARNLHCVMCGSAAMLTAVETANVIGGYTGHMLKYSNSGDSPYGGRDRVVGYGSFAIELE